jgi:hypothetical protein
MKHALFLFFFNCTYWGMPPIFAIVPKPGTAIEKYSKPAEELNNIGRLIVNGEKKTSSCSSTLIGIDGDVGIILTAGHCAELTREESVKKCRFQTISFAPNKTDSDPQQMPVVGRFALGKYIESSVKLAYDLGIVFVDLKDSFARALPKLIQLDSKKILPKSVVQVVGYGRTSETAEEKAAPPQRRAMSTQAFRTKDQDRDLLLLDETEIENQSMLIPVGDHPAEGDSGGPIIDAISGEIIGVVSHRSPTNSFYSEPLYPHAEWLLAQIKNASRYLVFKPKKSGNMSENSTWTEGRRPIQFKNAYGEFNPTLEIDGKTTLSLDDDLSIYAINMVGQGGVLDLQKDQSAEVLRINAPTVIQSSTSNTLNVDDVSINTSDISLHAKLRVLHTFRIQKDSKLDTKKDDPTRGVTLLGRGKINVEGTLKTHHVQFSSSHLDEEAYNGLLQVTGTLISDQPIRHAAHTVQGVASAPGKILGDYSLEENGILKFNLDISSPSSIPVLTFDGIVNFNGGKVIVDALQALPIGFERTLMVAKELNIALDWKGVYFIDSLNANTEIEFIRKPNTLNIKVVPKDGQFSTSSPADELLK